MALIALTLLPGEKPKDRLLSFILGAGMLAYGVYVAKQTTGTYYFPIYIFLVPIVVVAKSLSRLKRS